MGIVRYSRLIPAQKHILALIGVTLLFEVINTNLVFSGNANLWTMHLNIPLETVLLVSAFDSEYKLPFKYLAVLIVTPILFAVTNGLFIQPFYSHVSSYSSILQALICIPLLLKYLQLILTKDDLHGVLKFPLLIVLIAFSLYNIYLLLYFGLYNLSLYSNQTFPAFLHNLHIVFNFILYLAILYSFRLKNSLIQVP